jgi:hypothetical protein
MFKKLVYLVKVIYATIKVQKATGRIDTYIDNLKAEEEMIIDGNKIKITTDNISVLASGFRYGLCSYSNLTGEMIFSIVKETKVSKLGIEDFVIQHEIGHLTNEIFNNPLFWLNAPIRTLSNECAADLYAAEQIGFDKAIEALKILSKDPTVNTFEINSRINYLEMKKDESK